MIILNTTHVFFLPDERAAFIDELAKVIKDICNKIDERMHAKISKNN